MVADSVGYINMGIIRVNDVPRIITEFRDTKAIIFDVRNYPQGTMYAFSNFLNPIPTPFVKFTLPKKYEPGKFFTTRTFNSNGKNKNFYRGKTIILFNEQTQSHAEFTCMALQTAPNHISIGSQTSGADGNVAQVVCPGGYKTWITGLGVFYPDGRATQRVGIVPDIEIRPTAADLAAGRDAVLEKAIGYANALEP